MTERVGCNSKSPKSQSDNDLSQTVNAKLQDCLERVKEHARDNPDALMEHLKHTHQYIQELAARNKFDLKIVSTCKLTCVVTWCTSFFRNQLRNQCKQHAAVAEALQIIEKIAGQECGMAELVFGCGAIEPLILLITCDREDLSAFAVLALGKMGGYPKLKRLLLNRDILPALLSVLKKFQGDSTAACVAWALRNITREVESTDEGITGSSPFNDEVPAIAKEHCLLLLNKLFRYRESRITRECCWIIYHIISWAALDIVRAGLVARLVELLVEEEDDSFILDPCIASLERIIAGKFSHVAVREGVVHAFSGLLTHDDPVIVEKSVVAIANVAAGPPDQQEAVREVAETLLTSLDLILQEESLGHLKQDVAYAIYNIVACLPDSQVATVALASADFKTPLLQSLLQIQFDSRNHEVTLDILKLFLRILQIAEADGSASLESTLMDIKQIGEVAAKIKVLTDPNLYSCDIVEAAEEISLVLQI